MATQEQVDKLKLILGDCALSNEQLGEMIDLADGDLQLATASAWTRLASERVTMVNVSEAGSSRSLGDVFSNTLKMAEFHRRGVATEVPTATARPTVVRRIERE